MIRLQNSLYLLKNSSNYIEDVVTILPPLNREISADNGVRPISSENMDAIGAFPDNAVNVLVNRENALYSSSRNIMMLNRQANINCILQIKLSNSILSQTLASFVRTRIQKCFKRVASVDYHTKREKNINPRESGKYSK